MSDIEDDHIETTAIESTTVTDKYTISIEIKNVTRNLIPLFMSSFFVDLILPFLAFQVSNNSDSDDISNINDNNRNNSSGLIIGLVVSSQTVGVALSALIIGRLTDNRLVIPKIVTFACILKAIANILIYLSVVVFDSLVLLVCGAFLLGCTGAAITIPVKTLLADATELEQQLVQV